MTESTIIDSIVSQFPAALHESLWRVGGSVRDLLLGLPAQDADLVCSAPGTALAALGFYPVTGKSTAPIWFRSHPQLGKIEVTLLAEGQHLEAELARRDFRCNAVAMALDGAVIDPLGGREDIEERILRPCSPESLADDPLRIFRALRFAAHGWHISGELEGMVKCRSWEEEFAAIPVERFSREMMKALAGSDPVAFFRGMIGLNVGRSWLPELFAMLDVPAGPLKYHPEGDLFIHTVETLERMARLTDDPLPRLAALFHDLGKLTTPPEMLPRHIGHDERGVPMARDLCRRLKLPASAGRACAAASALHLSAGRWHEMRDTSKLKLARSAIKEGIAPWLPLLVTADRNDSDPMPEWDDICRIAAMPAAELGLTAEQLERVPAAERGKVITEWQLKRYRGMVTGE